MSKYQIKAEPLTAIHIGTGKTLSPLEYYIKENGNNTYELKRFKLEKIISTLPEKKRKTFNSLLDENDILKIRKFINNNISEECVVYHSPVSKSVYFAYRDKLNDMNNQLLIEEIYRDQRSFSPIIPGSSIKGAIRTAILSRLGESFQQLNGKFAEKDILGFKNAKDDPFRALQVSDCIISGDNKEYISDFVNFKENRNNSMDFASMQMFNEQIRGKLLKGDAIGSFEIILNEGLFSISTPLNSWDPIKSSFSIADIMFACNYFYSRQLENEYNKFYRNSKYAELKDHVDLIIEEFNSLKNNECIIRLGRFSQVESITIEKHRKPWNEKGYGQTRTLSEEKYSMGWLKCQFNNSEIEKSKIKLFSKEKKTTDIPLNKEDIKEGGVYTGIIRSIKPFGAFVDFFGASGLVHISEIRKEYIQNIGDFLSIGQKVKVKVLEIKEDGKISLTMKNVK